MSQEIKPNWKRELTGRPEFPLVMGQSLRVDQLNPLRCSVGQSGITCVVVFKEDFDTPALVLIHDHGDVNDGVSATNAMPELLTSICKSLGLGSSITESRVIQHDSMGMYDQVVPRWRATGCDDIRCIETGWLPLTWGNFEPRSRQVFGVFCGEASTHANAMVGSLREAACN
jgi:hypothetical protein